MNIETRRLSLYLENDEAFYYQARSLAEETEGGDAFEDWMTSFLDPERYADDCGVDELGTWLKHYWPMLREIGDLRNVEWEALAENFRD